MVENNGAFYVLEHIVHPGIELYPKPPRVNSISSSFVIQLGTISSAQAGALAEVSYTFYKNINIYMLSYQNPVYCKVLLLNFLRH